MRPWRQTLLALIPAIILWMYSYRSFLQVFQNGHCQSPISGGSIPIA